MSRLKQLSEARLEITKAATRRWKERREHRADTQRELAANGMAAVEAPDLIERFRARASGLRLNRAVIPSRLPAEFLAERIVGDDNRNKLPQDQAQLQAGVPVARIAEINGDGIEPQGFGTGFMISDRLLMTNEHVLRNARETAGVGANFEHNYVQGGGLQRGIMFELDADTFFVNDVDLDYAIVAVKPVSLEEKPLSDYGFHPLISETGKVLINKRINIIQHPMGGGKQYATEGSGLVDRLDDFLHYETDTEPGSSGSPGFNDFWEVVALHHSGVPMTQGDTILNIDGEPWDPEQGEGAVKWIANEGVRISKIVEHLRGLTLNDTAKEALLQPVLSPVDTTGTESIPQRVIRTDGAEVHLSTTPATADAKTVIHVHGDARINTGTVNNPPLSTAQSAPIAESVSGPALLEKAIVFDPHYGRRRGYQRCFMCDFPIDLPSVKAARQSELVSDRHGNPMVLDYHHYSLVMNRKWLMQMWSVVNVDFSPEVRWDISRKEFGSDKWVHDPRISEALQISNQELYAPAKKFDRGHMVRRADAAWGVTREEVAFANSDTFHWTNCTPQHEAFNRSNRKGVWGKLENHIATQANAIENRLTLFSGPVLNERRAIAKDFGGGLFLVPLDFWKVIVVAERKTPSARPTLSAYGFVLEQESAIVNKGLEKLSLDERFDVGEFAPQQRSLAAIEKLSDIQFPDNVRKADVMIKAASGAAIKLDGLEKVMMRAGK